jgi:Transmembrane exosortase (Exosortase_EpsH)
MSVRGAIERVLLVALLPYRLADELRLDEPGRIAHLSIIGHAFLLAYLPTLAILQAKYSEVDSYYGHGYVIPVISGVVVWHNRHVLKRTPVVPSRVGLGVLGGSLLPHLLGGWWHVTSSPTCPCWSCSPASRCISSGGP